MGGDSSPAPAAQTNTVTQVQQIPAYQQQAIQNDEATATSLASNPYPAYGAPIVAGLNNQEMAGLNEAAANAYDYTPEMTSAAGQAFAGNAINPLATDPTQNASYGQYAVTNSNPMASTTAAVNNQLAIGQQSNVTPQSQQAAGNYVNLAASQNPMAATTAGVNQSLDQGSNIVSNASAANPFPQTSSQVNALQQATLSGQANNPGVIASYMNPYIQQSLAPQLMQAQLNLTGQQNQLNAGATGANAFGDSRQATQSALANYYGDQTMGGIEAQGLNTGYNNAVTAAQNQQQMYQTQAQTANQLGALGVSEQNAQNSLANTSNAMANTKLGLGTLGINEQNVDNSLANTQLGIGALGVNQQNASNAAAQTQLGLGNMGVQEQGVMQNQQTLGMNEQGKEQTQQQIDNANAAQWLAIGQQQQNQTLAAANAEYNVGNIEQTNQQQQLNAAYQQYENQVNWPYQQLNVMESAVNSSPYQIANATTLPQASSTQAGLNAFTGLAGSLGSLYGSNNNTSSTGQAA